MDKNEKILTLLNQESQAASKKVQLMLGDRITELVTEKVESQEKIILLRERNSELVVEKDNLVKQYEALLLENKKLEQQVGDLNGKIYQRDLKEALDRLGEINADKITATHLIADPIPCHSAKASDILYDTKLIPGETVFVNGQAYYVKSVDIITGEYVLERADLPTTEKTTIKDRNDGSIVVFEKDHPTNRMYAIQANWWSHAKISRFLHKRCSGAFMKADERGVSLIVTPYNRRAIHANVGDWLLALVEHPTELYVCSKDTFWKIYAKE